jgi:beta-lactamase regulating signal transducer with metallopeptidase domain
MSAIASVWADALLRASVQGGLTIAVLWIVLRLLPRIPAAVQVWVWRIALLKMFVALLAPIAVSTSAPGPVGFAASPAPASPFAAIVLAVSVGGLVLVLSDLLSQLVAVRALRRGAVGISSGALVQIAEGVGRRMKLLRMPELMLSSQIDRPMVVGPWRPTILLPARLVAESTADEIRLVLSHELAHVRRGDLGWGWVVSIADLVFFFHPLVWLVRRELRTAQEASCDALALGTTAASPADYGRLLIRLARGRHEPDYASSLAVGGFDALKERVTRLADRRRVHPAAAVAALLIALLALPAWRFEPTNEVGQVREETAWGTLALPAGGTPTRFAHEVPVAQKTTPEEGNR